MTMDGTTSTTLILTSGAIGRVNALFSWRVINSLAMLIAAVIYVITAPFRVGARKRNPSSPSSSPEKDQKGVVRVPAKVVPWLNVAVAVDHESAARRAIAMRRVVKDEFDGNTIREFALFGTPRGDTLFTQSWSPVSVKTRAVVILLHGLNEHSGRYNDFSKKLNANGYKVYGMDWIGHGGSDGLHAYVPCLDYPVADLKLFLEKVLGENPGLPCFCFGHSTGGAIILKATLDPKVEARVAGAVLTSPAVGVQPNHAVLTALAPVFSFLLPRYPLSAANKNGTQVSRCPEALKEKYSDPLVYTGAIRVRTGTEILRITAHLQQNRSRVRVPLLILHGSADSVTDPEASEKLYDEASSCDKTFRLLDGCLHDLLFEPEKDAVVNYIINWLNNRVDG